MADTVFPTAVDDRIYYSDASIDDIPTMRTYQSKLREGKYIEASEFLCESGMNYFGAWVLNMYEGRLVALEEYLVDKEKPDLTRYQSAEPLDVTDSSISWIGD